MQNSELTEAKLPSKFPRITTMTAAVALGASIAVANMYKDFTVPSQVISNNTGVPLIVNAVCTEGSTQCESFSLKVPPTTLKEPSSKITVYYPNEIGSVTPNVPGDQLPCSTEIIENTTNTFLDKVVMPQSLAKKVVVESCDIQIKN